MNYEDISLPASIDPLAFMDPPLSSIPQRQSARIRKPPSYSQTYHCNLIQITSPSFTFLNNSKTSPHQLSSILSYDLLSPTQKHFSLSISVITVPKTYNQANMNVGAKL